MRRQNILMMLLVGLMGLISPMVAKSQSVEWFKAFTQASTDTEVLNIKIDSQDNIYVIAKTYSSSFALLIIKCAPDGSVLWSKKKSDDKALIAQIVLLDSSDNLYVLSDRGLVLKYAPNGTLLWQFRSDAETNFATGMVLDPSGNLYITSTTDATNPTDTTSFLTKVDVNGKQLWRQRFHNREYAYVFQAVALDATGNIFVTGKYANITDPNHSITNLWTGKFDSTTGKLLWRRIYDAKLNANESGDFIHVDTSGNVYVVGNIFTGGYLILAVKYDTNGNRLWASYYNRQFDGGDHPLSACMDASDNLCIFCNGKASDGRPYFVLLSYTPSGKRRWIANTVTTAVNGNALEHGTVDSSFAYAVGYNYNANTSSMLLVKYDIVTGKGKKTVNYSAKGFDYSTARKVAVDAHGNIYMGGDFSNSTSIQIGLLKLKP